MEMERPVQTQPEQHPSPGTRTQQAPSGPSAGTNAGTNTSRQLSGLQERESPSHRERGGEGTQPLSQYFDSGPLFRSDLGSSPRQGAEVDRWQAQHRETRDVLWGAEESGRGRERDPRFSGHGSEWRSSSREQLGGRDRPQPYGESREQNLHFSSSGREWRSAPSAQEQGESAPGRGESAQVREWEPHPSERGSGWRSPSRTHGGNVFEWQQDALLQAISTLASSARVSSNATLEKKASEDIDALKPGETEHPVQQIMLVHELALCTSLRQLTEHDLCALLERKLPSGRGLRPSEVQGNAPIMARLLDKLKGRLYKDALHEAWRSLRLLEQTQAEIVSAQSRIAKLASLFPRVGSGSKNAESQARKLLEMLPHQLKTLIDTQSGLVGPFSPQQIASAAGIFLSASKQGAAVLTVEAEPAREPRIKPADIFQGFERLTDGLHRIEQRVLAVQEAREPEVAWDSRRSREWNSRYEVLGKRSYESRFPSGQEQYRGGLQEPSRYHPSQRVGWAQRERGPQSSRVDHYDSGGKFLGKGEAEDRFRSRSRSRSMPAERSRPLTPRPTCAACGKTGHGEDACWTKPCTTCKKVGPCDHRRPLNR